MMNEKTVNEVRSVLYRNGHVETYTQSARLISEKRLGTVFTILTCIWGVFVIGSVWG